jgi:hypothetical protein
MPHTRRPIMGVRSTVLQLPPYWLRSFMPALPLPSAVLQVAPSSLLLFTRTASSTWIISSTSSTSSAVASVAAAATADWPGGPGQWPDWPRATGGGHGGHCAAGETDLRAVQTQNPKTHHLVLDQRMFLWASYVLGQDIDEVWWPTDLVSGYKRGPECRKNGTCT